MAKIIAVAGKTTLESPPRSSQRIPLYARR